MVIGRNRPDPTKKTQQFGAAAASYSPRRSRRSNNELYFHADSNSDVLEPDCGRAMALNLPGE
jgi:hypothetical protein